MSKPEMSSDDGASGDRSSDATTIFPYHAKTKEECYRQLKIDRDDLHRTGLTADEAKERLETYGYNQLTESVKVTIWQRIYNQVANVLVGILAIVAIVSIIQAIQASSNNDTEGVVTDIIQVALIVFVVV